MGIISLEQTDRLYWLGRYSERVYTTIRLFSQRYDIMIDEIEESYGEFCRSLEIPNIYTSSRDFCRRYCFDETDPNSIYSNLIRAYDNAVVLREELGSETLSYIQLAIYDMNKAKTSEAPILQFQKISDNILAFWGMVDDSIASEKVRNIIKSGKRIECIDLYARLKLPRNKMEREVMRLADRIPKSGMNYEQERVAELLGLVRMPELDYYQIVQNVESIIR